MEASESLTWWESIILGTVQGITEFLPISSDGHLVLARHLLDYQKDILVFDVLLHMGTLGSLLVVFHKDIRQLLKDSVTAASKVLSEKSIQSLTQPTSNDRYMIYVWITTFVTGVVGLVGEKTIEELFKSLGAAGVGFLITCVFLLIGSLRSSGQKKVWQLSWWFPVAIGFAQSLALLPGVSRSGCTIAFALACSIHKNEAGRYSFVAAIPIIFLASIYQSRHLLAGQHENLWIVSLGVLSSFIVGVLAIKLLLWMLNKQNLYPFVIYTGLLGIVSLIYVYV